MAIDPAGTPEVNPQVDTDYTTNLARSPYSSTTEDLLDKIHKAVAGVSINVSGGTFTNNGFTSGWLKDTDRLLPIWCVATRDAGTGVVTVEYFEYPGGPSYVPTGMLLPLEFSGIIFLTARLDGNSATPTATPWQDASPLFALPKVNGVVGKALFIPGPFTFVDIRVLNSSDDDPAAGFYIDEDKTRFYPSTNGAVSGVLGIQRGSNTQQGAAIQDLYVEAVGNCQLEITITV